MKLSLRSQFYLLVIPLVGALIVLLGAAMMSYFLLQKDTGHIEADLAKTLALQDFATAFTEQSREYADFLVTGASADEEESRSAANASRLSLAKWRQLAKADRSLDLETIRLIETERSKVTELGEQIIRLAKEGRHSEAADILTRQVQPLLVSVSRRIDESLLQHRNAISRYVNRTIGGIEYTKILRFGRLHEGIQDLDSHVAEVLDAAAFKQAVEGEVRGYWYYFLSRDRELQGAIGADRHRAAQSLFAWRLAVKNYGGAKNFGGPHQKEELRFVDDVHKQYAQLSGAGKQVIALVDQGSQEQAKELMLRSLSFEADGLQGTLEKYVDYETEVAAANLGFLRKESNRVRVIVLLAGFAAVLIGVCVPALLSRRMINPILNLQRAAERIGKGELETQVSASSIHELASLATTFNKMANELRTSAESLRTSEERFQLAARVTSDVIWDWDSRTNQIWISEGLRTPFGYPQQDNVSADLWYATVHRDDLQRVRASLEAALAGSDESWSQEYRFRRADGAFAHVYNRASIVRDADGTSVRMIGAVMDVTQRHEVERLKSEFVSTVSHELRTPLTSIRGALGLLGGGLLGKVSAKGQRMLEIAISNTDRLVRLINDILDIEGLDSGQVTITRQNLDGANLMQQALDVMKPMADQAGVAIHVHSLHGMISADQDRMIQTLTNLLSNAIKFSAAGTTVTMAAERDRRMLRFQVTDQGRGIPADKLKTIFERFQQVDASDSRDKGGTGLGLPICRSIVQQHGGRMWVESILGEGSTFFFTVPLIEEEIVQPVIAVERAFHHSVRRQIFLIEDDVDLARVLTEGFERHGIQTVHAANGAAAIELAQKLDPDLVILDLVLLDMDGFAVVDWLKDNDRLRSVPMIVYSTMEPTPSQRQRLSLGPTEFLTKSRILPEEFERRVIQLLDRMIVTEGALSDVA